MKQLKKGGIVKKIQGAVGKRKIQKARKLSKRARKISGDEPRSELSGLKRARVERLKRKARRKGAQGRALLDKSKGRNPIERQREKF